MPYEHKGVVSIKSAAERWAVAQSRKGTTLKRAAQRPATKVSARLYFVIDSFLELLDTPRLHTVFLYSLPYMFHTSLTTNLICDKDAHTALAGHTQHIHEIQQHGKFS